MSEDTKTKCGYVAVVGRPNVGKSTLLNQFMGRKLSIVTPKPQTTRNRVLAVHNTSAGQVVFLDTPGIHSPKGQLGKYMNNAAHNAVLESDVVLWLIDGANPKRGEGLTHGEITLAERLSESNRKTIAIINKVDRISDKSRLLPLLEAVSKLPGIETVIPISAKNGDGTEIVMKEILSMLPEGDPMFPDDIISDKADRFFVSELVREAIINLTHQEIPYRVAVTIDQFVEGTAGCEIHATIHVERTSQKGILIGKGGTMIKEIGIRARAEAAKLLACEVDLRLHVSVSPDWTNKPTGLLKMGYE